MSSTTAEITRVKRALSSAIEAAATDYLIAEAGSDLPDNQLVLDEYNFEVSRIAPLSFMVRAKHKEHQIMAFHFEVKVSGG
jgi:hypothetical protein